MNTQATSLNRVQLKQSANWCSFFTQNDLIKNTITSPFLKNKWEEYVKVKKIKIKKSKIKNKKINKKQKKKEKITHTHTHTKDEIKKTKINKNR